MYLGARFQSHSSFRYTEGWHGLHNPCKLLWVKIWWWFFFFLLNCSKFCIPFLSSQALPPPSSQFYNTHPLLSTSTSSVQKSNDERGRERTGRCHQPIGTTVPLGPAPANDCLSLLWVIIPRFHLFHFAGTSPPSDAQPFFSVKAWNHARVNMSSRKCS